MEPKQFTYSVLAVNQDVNMMEIEYKSPGQQPVRSVVRLPFSHETLDEVATIFAPTRVWFEQTLEFRPVSAGDSGSGVAREERPLTPQEIAVSRRDAELLYSDWTQLPDAPLTQEGREAWAAYRQALRDVPQQEGFPENISWPTAPAS